jgi:3-deoxy-manno-octulosonate cytidylyltransferase (CMP-KDO synthetase)
MNAVGDPSSAATRVRTLAVIPARYGSQRFPGKPLADLGGKPVIQHVYERTLRARGLDATIVATDDERIAGAVRAFGGRVAMTRSDHKSGTERAAEVARSMPSAELILNIQGDEPFVDPASIEALLLALDAPAHPSFVTLREPLDEADSDRPHVVKVVTTLSGDALYFSRAPIPYRRDRLPASVFRHVGLYGFRREGLLWFASLAPTPLEGSEGLEQLRILEHGGRIFVAEAHGHTLSIDTPEDLERAKTRLAKGLA